MDLSAQIIALGAWNQVTKLGQYSVAAKADYFTATVSSDGAGEAVDGTDAGSSGIRLAAEMSAGHAASSDQPLSYAFELGARQDGGEAESGVGVDASAEFDYGGPGSSVRVTGKGGLVVFHGQAGFSETGFGLEVAYGPGADARGFQLSLRPTWNAPRSNGADLMWSSDFIGSLSKTSDRGAAVRAGLAMASARFVTGRLRRCMARRNQVLMTV